MNKRFGFSEAYALAHNGTITHKGSAKAMRKLLKQNGGYKNGWQLWVTSQPIGYNINADRNKVFVNND